MASFVIEGGHRLSGEIHPQGAKNEVLQIICATLLTAEEVTVNNIPDILDVNNLIQLMREMGVTVAKEGIDTYSFKAENVDLAYLESDKFLKKCSSLRGSVMLIGPMVARFGKALISKPGGDKIGRRRLDTHFVGIQNLGADFRYDESRGIYEITADRLQGSYMLLDEASVTGTANILMAAVLAKGTTTIYNAACEPYLQQLCRMLNRMGAKISGIASNLLTIEGVEELHPVTHRVVGDRIEAGTFIVAGALMADDRGVDVTGFCPIHLGMVLKKMELMGIDCERVEDGVHVNRAERIKPVDIQTLPFPGFPTDMQAQIMVLSALADGSSVITENIFENRFMFASELVRMGADIRIESHHAMIHGVKGFSGAQVTSPDLRGGAALVVAGLIADGTTEVSAIHHIKRGYEQFVEKLQALGAHVEHASVPDPVIY